MERKDSIKKLVSEILDIVETRCPLNAGLRCENCVYYEFGDKCMAVLVAEGLTDKEYVKVDEGSVVLTREELTKHDEDIRKETAREIFSDIDKYSDKCFETVDNGIDCETYNTFDYCKFFRWFEKYAKKFGVEVKE